MMERTQQNPYGAELSSAGPSTIDPHFYPDTHPSEQVPESPSIPSSPESSHSTSSRPANSRRSKQRACDRCRQLKVRCIRDDESHDSQCLRCRSAKHASCITTPSTRKRKRVAVDWKAKVADLEQQMQHKDGDWRARILELEHKFATLQGEKVMPAQKRVHLDSSEPTPNSNSNADMHMPEELDELRNEFMSRAGAFSSSKAKFPAHQVSNINSVVDKILDKDMIDFLFHRYVQDMYPCFPAVRVQEQTAVEMREKKPLLFLAMLNASSFGPGRCSTETCVALNELFLEQFGEVCRYGLKSLEIIQALQIFFLWYRPPERFERINFTGLACVAISMAHELGLTKPPKSTEVVMRSSIESRRALLVCYWSSSSMSIVMKRSPSLRWSKYINDCVQFLEASNDSQGYDIILCQHIRLMRIGQQVVERFELDDPRDINFADTGTIQTLDELEGELESTKEEWQTKPISRSVSLEIDTVDICMHEIALYTRHIPSSLPEKLTGRLLSKVARLRDAFEAAMQAALSLLSQFREIDTTTLFNLPVVFSIRFHHAIRTLLAGCSLGPKLFVNDKNYDSQELVNAMERAQSSLNQKYTEMVTFDPNSPQSRHFQLANGMMAMYAQMKNNPGNKDVIQAQTDMECPFQITPKTPLHLLSDVAAGGMTTNLQPMNPVNLSASANVLTSESSQPISSTGSLFGFPGLYPEWDNTFLDMGFAGFNSLGGPDMFPFVFEAQFPPAFAS